MGPTGMAEIYIQADGCGYNVRFDDARGEYEWFAEGLLPDYIKTALPANAERDSEVLVEINTPTKNVPIGACMKAENVPDETRDDEEEEDIMSTQEITPEPSRSTSPDRKRPKTEEQKTEQ